MANAKTDEVEVMVPSTEKRIVLTLTEAEANYLSGLLGFKVIGTGELRDLNTSIWNALSSETGDIALSQTSGSVTLTKDSESYPYL